MTGLIKKIGKVLGKAADPFGTVSDVYHAVTRTPTESEKRDQMKLIKSQMDAYKSQTEMTTQALNEARAAKDVEKRRIEEKQIRGLRNSYRRPGGLIGNQSATLGNEAPLPNKLGTA